MRKLIFTMLALVLVNAGNGFAMSVYCTNCSNRFVQALERVTNISQLTTLMDQYSEDLIQTEQQVRMVQQNIEQIANMVKNTNNLDEYTLRGLKNRFVRLGRLVGAVSQHRGEVKALEDVYRNTYPNSDQIRDLVEQGEEYDRKWKRWSRRVDAASMATFQLSGQQLSEISESAEFDAHVQKLLSDPEGRMQAIQASNQLSALQIEEARLQRALLATYVQQRSQTASKEEKENQSSRERWKNSFSSDVLDNARMENASPATTNNF